MKFAVVAHRATETNRALAAAAPPDVHGFLATPQAALAAVEPGDVVLGRLDVRSTLDGMQEGSAELNHLAAQGVRVLNAPSALLAAHDKLLTARLLRLAGLPHPRTTVLGNARLAFPLVLKPRFGSWGRDVTLCRDEAELGLRIAELADRPWLGDGAILQELMPTRGHDLRLVVAGGRVVGAARRLAAPGEWRTNVALGGRSAAVIPPPVACSLAEEAAAAIGADLVGVDLLPDGGGDWTILELNGAVDFKPRYSLVEDVYAAAVRALIAAPPRLPYPRRIRIAEPGATRP
jgi:RimK family alpha-L-glutamate ligase